jgi:hypothetical protein
MVPIRNQCEPRETNNTMRYTMPSITSRLGAEVSISLTDSWPEPPQQSDGEQVKAEDNTDSGHEDKEPVEEAIRHGPRPGSTDPDLGVQLTTSKPVAHRSR